MRALAVLGIAVAAALAAVAGGGSILAQVSGESVLATSIPEGGPIRLGAEPTRIRLSDDAVEVVRRARAFAAGERVYLVLDQVHANRQPGVLYDVFLSATDGESPRLDTAQLVGHFNLFERRKPLISFDVTERLRGLVDAPSSARKLVVTIRPALGNEPTVRPEVRRSLEQADVTIARVRLVAH